MNMKRTLLTGILAAVIALGAGAFVADAANHSSLGSSSAESFGGGFGGPPPNGARPFPGGN